MEKKHVVGSAPVEMIPKDISKTMQSPPTHPKLRRQQQQLLSQMLPATKTKNRNPKKSKTKAKMQRRQQNKHNLAYSGHISPSSPWQDLLWGHARSHTVGGLMWMVRKELCSLEVLWGGRSQYQVHVCVLFGFSIYILENIANRTSRIQKEGQKS